MTDQWPTVPERQLERGGWRLADRSRERLFELPRVAVDGHTLLYEEPSVGEQLGVDEPLCFFFATRLDFEPALPPGASRLVEPMIRTRARSQFIDDLRKRGFADLQYRTDDDFQTAAGQGGQLTTVRGSCILDDWSVDATGWLAVWRDDDFFVAGGGYPHTDAARDGERNYREELLELLRNVS